MAKVLIENYSFKIEKLRKSLDPFKTRRAGEQRWLFLIVASLFSEKYR